MSSYGTSDGGGNKRRKTSPADNVAPSPILDLDDDTLKHVASYIPSKMSLALLSVAMTAPPSSFRERGWEVEPSSASRAIISSVDEPWEELNLCNIKESLAKKLSDDDLGAMLVCIDATRKLKNLIISPHLIRVKGKGLDPLRSSTSLENITVGRDLDDRPLISQEIIFSIVDSILRCDGNAFTRLRPSDFWEYSSDDRNVDALSEHEHLLNVHSGCCYFGLTPKEAVARINNSSDSLDSCVGCNSSEDIKVCFDCNRLVCAGSDCYGMGLNFVCKECGITSCSDCTGEGQEEGTVTCCFSESGGSYEDNGCPYCQECRRRSCRDGTNDCKTCKGVLFDEMLEERNEQLAENSAKQALIDSQQEEIKVLRRELQELRVRLA